MNKNYIKKQTENFTIDGLSTKKTTFFFHSSKKSEQSKGKIKHNHKICEHCVK